MDTYSGAYGFVVQPDIATQAEVDQLIMKYAGLASFQTPRPHLTLYHAALKRAPEDRIRRILENCERILAPGTEIPLGPVAQFGEKFLFWDVPWRGDDSLTRTLFRAHHAALALADFRNESVTTGRQAEEKLQLTPEEQENVRKYGHPLVSGQWRPHLTLAHDERGFKGVYPDHPHIMTVVAVRFVHIGPFGSVLDVIF